MLLSDAMTREVIGDVAQHGGLWYWRLQIGHSPLPNPIAMSGIGLRTRKQALKTLAKAKRAFAAEAGRNPDFHRKFQKLVRLHLRLSSALKAQHTSLTPVTRTRAEALRRWQIGWRYA